MQRLHTLFLSFFKIGLFTFGGGYAMLSLIEQELIVKRGWIERKEFLNMLTLAQSAPGPIAVNTAVFVGYKLRGVKGALASLVGMALPSFLIILAIALFFQEIKENPIVAAAFKGMRPAVVALIVAPVLSLARGLHWGVYPLILLSALAVWGLGWSPVYVILLAAVGGIAWELIVVKTLKKRAQ